VKGVHRVTKRLASGGVAVYHYAWRGGPRLPGEPGSAEFLAALAAAKAEGPPHHKGTLQEVFNAYQSSPQFTSLSDATRAGYKRRLPAIEAEFGDMPIKALTNSAVRGEFLDWRGVSAYFSASPSINCGRARQACCALAGKASAMDNATAKTGAPIGQRSLCGAGVSRHSLTVLSM